MAACAGARTIVTYNAHFERQYLEHLAAAVPAQRKALRAVARRLVDLLPIVRDNVYHPKFGGSFSLKSVVPALVPGLGYEDLDIGEGSTAQTLLEALLLSKDSIPATARKKLFDPLHHNQVRHHHAEVVVGIGLAVARDVEVSKHDIYACRIGGHQLLPEFSPARSNLQPIDAT